MAQVIPFLPGSTTAFDGDTTELIVRAFDQACLELHVKGEPDIVKELIAKRIIEFAGRGERNVGALCAAAISSFGIGARQ